MKRAFPVCLAVLVSTVGPALGQQAGRPDASANPVICPYGPPDYGNHGGPSGATYTDAPNGCGCGAGCAGRGLPQDFIWADAEYLAWWIKKGPVAVPLVTIDGAPALIGDHGIDYDTFSGGRWSAGFWVDCEHLLGFDASGFLLENRPEQFSAQSDLVGRPMIARPFFNELTGAPDAQLVSAAGILSGGVAITSHSKLWGVEGNARSCVVGDDDHRLCVLAGFRYVDLREDLNIFSESMALPGSMFTFDNTQLQNPGTVSVTDQFITHNRFYGGQIGAESEFRRGCFFVSVVGKIAVGENQEHVTISGTSSASGGAPSPLASGLLAVSSNSGVFRKDEFAVVPEMNLRLGYHFNHYVSAYIGYTFLYWSDVVRPGDQIDPVINPTLISTDPSFRQTGGTARPAPVFRTSDFWAQGLDFGIALNY